MKYKILSYDDNLVPFEKDIALRMQRYETKKKELLPDGGTLADFANGSDYFGFHKTKEGWFYREWAPAADKLWLTGEFCNWDRQAHPMQKLDNGVFELFLPGVDTLRDGMLVMTVVERNGQLLERIPLYARRVVQDPQTTGWSAVIYDPDAEFQWTDKGITPKKNLFIYLNHCVILLK